MSDSAFMVPLVVLLVVLLSVFVPMGTVGTILGSIALLTYHRRALHRQQQVGQLVQQMLQREMTADEIERVLLACHADPQLVRKLRNEPLPLKKYLA